jgi:hypothetical protein
MASVTWTDALICVIECKDRTVASPAILKVYVPVSDIIGSSVPNKPKLAVNNKKNRTQLLLHKTQVGRCISVLYITQVMKLH